MEDNIEGLGKGRVIIQQDFKNLETELQETRTQVAKLQRKQLRQNNKIALARFKITDLEQIIKEIQARHQADKETSAASASDAPAMNQATIRQLVVDSVAAALKAQAANMANTKNTNRNPEPRETLIARKCSYKEFMSCQPFNFKGSEGVVGLIHWFEHTKLVFSRRNYTKDCKDRKAYKITWVEFKKLLKRKYYPRIEVQKIEDEFYHLTVKGNDLKTYVRRFQELATLCPTMVSDSEKMIEAFIGGLPRSIEGNVTASKPLTLEKAINIAQRLMDQGCTLTLLNQPFKIDLMPIKIGSFNVIIGMDWLSKYHAKIIYDEKVIHIPIDSETLIIQGDRTQVMEKKSEDKRLEDIRLVREFPDVFPEDLPGLPLNRQVEFQIKLVLGATPVARAPYRLALSEMHELSDQL
uniref:Reverse transcriptase domain-containing protein n=1 Tax=Tanacetum cinerariifolium TaxID=118510 RepID=A0A6L2NFA4_TANCI|nr:reverse transcriptase domain-containing protein [Tanacetum cinerariifolium]